MLLLHELDEIGVDRVSYVPARLYWLSERGVLKRAKIRYGSNRMRSVFVNAYTARKRTPLAVHRILGWTLRCPWALDSLRWDRHYDVHHEDTNHCNNAISNLKCWRAHGRDGHRAHSGAEGAYVRWVVNRRVQEESGESEVEEP